MFDSVLNTPMEQLTIFAQKCYIVVFDWALDTHLLELHVFLHHQHLLVSI